MKGTRREFIKSLSFIVLAYSLPIKTTANLLIDNSKGTLNKYLKRAKEIIASLKNEKSNIVLKVMNGLEYKFDPYFHYPKHGGIVDSISRSRVFFHSHRNNEYGHFHTFVENEKGELIHLVLISMREDGTPKELATVNRWVTDDTYVNSEELKKYFNQFQINVNLFSDKRLLEFINKIMLGYKEEIFKLFDERDEWIKNYAFKNFREPFDDRDFDVLSSAKINLI